MARKRYQQGSVYLVGKSEIKWVGRYREDVIGMDGNTKRVRREVILGSKRELPTKRLAQRRMDAVLARVNGPSGPCGYIRRVCGAMEGRSAHDATAFVDTCG